jgi:hypothetical protein
MNKKAILLGLMCLYFNPLYAQKNVSDCISIYTNDSINIRTSIISYKSMGKVVSKSLKVELFNASTKPIYVLKSNSYGLFGIQNSIIKKKPKAEFVVQAIDAHGSRTLLRLMPNTAMDYSYNFKDAFTFSPITGKIQDYNNEYDVEVIYITNIKERTCALIKQIGASDPDNICHGDTLPESFFTDTYYIFRWGTSTKIRNNHNPPMRTFKLTFPKK